MPKHHNPSSPAVAIVGLGAVTPVGRSASETWSALASGRSGIGPITRFDPSPFPVRIAGEVKNFDPRVCLSAKEAGRLDRFVHYAAAAADEALRESLIRLTPRLARRTAVVIGSSRGGIGTWEENVSGLLSRGFKGVSPFAAPMSLVNMAAGFIALKHGITGPTLAVSTACASGAHSVGEAARMIRDGIVDVAIAGGAEAPIVPSMLAAFAAARALSRRNDDPESASRPFDRTRDGFVLSEGAGIVVLESADHARRRGAKPLAFVAGYGATNDAYHYTRPAPGGTGAAAAIRSALADAGASPREVDCVIAHGTSSRENDRMETAAIKSVLGRRARKVPVVSLKSITGHLLGASSAVEAVAAAMIIRQGLIPPTINLRNPDPECDLDYTSEGPRRAGVRTILTNAFGFGGVNACLVIREQPE
ncbi:MAG: beta-ketoacyl-ACP synthase II [Nitrospirota bacterium]